MKNVRRAQMRLSRLIRRFPLSYWHTPIGQSGEQESYN